MKRTYTFDRVTGRYRDAHTGRFIPFSEVSTALYEALDTAKLEARTVAERLRAGTMTVQQAEVEMLRLSKNSAINSAVLARGGYGQMGPEDWGRVGRFLMNPSSSTRDHPTFGQFQFLRERFRDILSGKQLLDGTLAARFEAYVEAGKQLYSRELVLAMELRGFTDVRSRLESRLEACTTGKRPGCVEQQALGWVDVKDFGPGKALVPIGARQCLHNDRCRLEFRNPSTGVVQT